MTEFTDSSDSAEYDAEIEMFAAQLQRMDHSELPLRYKTAIKDLAENNHGSMIYLVFMMNDRINKLETALKEMSVNNV